MQLRYTGGKAEKEPLQVFNETMRELFEEDKRVVYLDADLMGSLKTAQLWKDYPKNVFNTGIQEANMIGVAAGMYLNGLKPYVHSFSPFASRPREAFMLTDWATSFAKRIEAGII